MPLDATTGMIPSSLHPSLVPPSAADMPPLAPLRRSPLRSSLLPSPVGRPLGRIPGTGHSPTARSPPAATSPPGYPQCEQPPKLLHSLLQNLSSARGSNPDYTRQNADLHVNGGVASRYHSMTNEHYRQQHPRNAEIHNGYYVRAEPMYRPTRRHRWQQHGRGHSRSSTVTSLSLGTQMRPEEHHSLAVRPQEVSLGSAASSLRDSRSPSHESLTSAESFPLSSPRSVSPRRSPSPPAPTESKLLGILRGTAKNPYDSLLQARNQGRTEHHANWRTPSKSNVDYTLRKEHSFSNGFDRTSENSIPNGVSKRKADTDQDEPIDLSCRTKRLKEDCGSRKLSWSPGDDSQFLSEPPPLIPVEAIEEGSDEEESTGGSESILHSILCGRLSGRNGFTSYSRSLRPPPTLQAQPPLVDMLGEQFIQEENKRQKLSVSSAPPALGYSPVSPVSVSSLPASTPASPVPSSTPNQAPSPLTAALTSTCPWKLRVTLAKKNLFPVRARVSNWLVELVKFATSLTEFQCLSQEDQFTLLSSAWARLMLIFMAETNFQFAVTPAHQDDSDQDSSLTGPGSNPTVPTVDSVEKLQGFIRKCQSLNIDNLEYHYIRMITLFHTSKYIPQHIGCNGIYSKYFPSVVCCYH